ncbi:MAG: hypothetical protein AAF529_02585 [Pseudomonadota bacterium]
MMLIDSDLQPSAEWITQATNAKEKVANAQPTERSKVINSYGHVWKNLKSALKQHSHDKCWYCESKDIRSDNAVDHFRPKGNVKGAEPAHHGYWWLAFEHENYRFSCTYCNSIRKGEDGTTGGKQDFFPLIDEADRAHNEDDDISEEYPVLLDPLSFSDVGLLVFSDDGMAGPAVEEANVIPYRRAKESIRLYHLNHKDIAERRAARMHQVRQWVKEGQKHFNRYNKNPADGYAKKNFDSSMRNIISATRRKAEFSSAARSALAGLAATHEIAATLVGRFD